jgi:hydrogenase maturation protease
MKRKGILVLGIGNYLMADEGIGVHTVRMLEDLQALPADVDLLDGGTGGFHLLEYFEHYEHVILIDATLDHYPPGTIRLIKPKFYSDFPPAMSTHDIGLKDLVGALQLLDRMPEVHLFVVSINSIQDQGIELTETAIKTLPELKDQITALVERLNIQQPAVLEV